MAHRILCAPDSFKGSLSAKAAAEAMAEGIRSALPDAQIDLCPVADGGEGTVEAMVAATNGELRTEQVTGPLAGTVQAAWGLLGSADNTPRTAVIEMAAASGLGLVPEAERDPTRTTTQGTGELIAKALDQGVSRILVGLGGSATNDGGCGMAMALGARFFDEHSNEMLSPVTGGQLARIRRIDMSGLDPRLRETEIHGLCDVNNPLTGPLGAALTFAPQKGATEEQVLELDAGLVHLAALFREQLGADIEHVPGAGAAGGLGAGLAAFCDARLRSGIETVLEQTGFAARVQGSDLCLTGEGQLDRQSLLGKACLGVAQAARKHGVSTWALVGSTGPGVEECLTAGLSGYEVIAPEVSRSESMQRAAELLALAVGRVVQGID